MKTPPYPLTQNAFLSTADQVAIRAVAQIAARTTAQARIVAWAATAQSVHIKIAFF